MGTPSKAYDGIYNRYLKRIIDVIIAIPLFVIALPFYVFISAAILLDDGFPVFYRPMRGGYKGKNFIAGKFGTVGVNKKRCLECA